MELSVVTVGLSASDVSVLVSNSGGVGLGRTCIVAAGETSSLDGILLANSLVAS